MPPGDGILALSPVTRRAGFPTRAELAARYAARSGRPVENLAWYEALAHWKAAIFCENMYQRFLSGERTDAFARLMETGVPSAKSGRRPPLSAGTEPARSRIGPRMPPPASHSPLTPLSALLHAGSVWGERPAVRWDDWRITYRELMERVARVAGCLAESGIEPGDRVAALLPNVPELLEMHFAAPAARAVFVPINVRVSGPELAYILEHCGARLLVTHPSLEAPVAEAVAALANPPRVVTTRMGAGDSSDYEHMLAAATPIPITGPADETGLLSINYTSGTTGRPKGVMYTHRGAYLHTLGVIAEAQLDTRTAYLWTLPMFHCHGWAFTWAVTAMGGEHRCLARFDAGKVWAMLAAGEVSHFCGAPTVLTMLAADPAATRLPRPVRVFVGGAPPSPALLHVVEELGMQVTHLYGLTETYGPIAVCAWQPAWDELDAPSAWSCGHARASRPSSATRCGWSITT